MRLKRFNKPPEIDLNIINLHPARVENSIRQPFKTSQTKLVQGSTQITRKFHANSGFAAVRLSDQALMSSKFPYTT